MQPLLPMLTAAQLEALSAMADDLASVGYHVRTEVLSPEWVEQLRAFAQIERNEGGFQEAGIGKLHQHNINKSIRGDSILWIEEQHQLPALEAINLFLTELRQYLNRTCYLGLRDYEMHLAVYPSGSFYKRHADRFNLKTHRHISFVFYLNTNWQPGHGGELRLYLPNKDVVTVEPTGGTLVVFRSEIEHEVLLAHQARYSLTGWMLDIEKGLTFL